MMQPDRLRQTIGLFVCGLNEVSRLRLPGSDERRRIRLPRPPWLLERFRHCGLDGCVLPANDEVNPRQAETQSLAVALLICSPGSCASGPLHWWESADDEASLQCEYLQYPLDAFSVVVETVWLIDEPFHISMARNHVELQDVRKGSKLFYPAYPDRLSEAGLHGIHGRQTTVAVALARVGMSAPDVLCLMVANPILQLAQRGFWRELVLLGRWLKSPALVTRPGNLRLSHRGMCFGPSWEYPLGWFEKWPDAYWLRECDGRHSQRDVVRNVNFDAVGQAASVIRKWHGAILRNIEDEETRAAEELHLSHVALGCQAISSAMSSSTSSHGLMRTAEQLFYAIDCALMCKSGADGLRDTCAKALKAMMSGIDIPLAPMLDSLPKPTTVKRHMVTLEVACLLYEQELDRREAAMHPDERPLRFGLSDASPAWGLEWLWNEHYYIPGGADLLSLLDDALAFIGGMREWLSLEHEDGDLQEVEKVPQHLRDLIRRIAPKVGVHIHTPVVVASGFLSLVHKLAATVQAFALGRCTLSRLPDYMDTFVAWTTDMGTEFGFAEFRTDDVFSLLPPWVNTAGAAADDVDMEEVAGGDVDSDVNDMEDMGAPGRAGEGAAAAAAASGVDGFVFRHALTIPGLLHIVHNVCKDMGAMYPGWSALWLQLKSCEALLTDKGRRRRFAKTCLDDTTHANFAVRAAFDSFSNTLYEKRWGCVISFVTALLPLMGFLRRAWSEEKYAHNVDGGDAARTASAADAGGYLEFDRGLFTRTVRSNSFLLELKLLLMIQGVAQGLANWGEVCPCHSGCLHGMSRRTARTYMEKFIALPSYNTCPFAGRRAPELASGQLSVVFETLAATGFNDLLLSESASFATAEELNRLRTIFTTCKNHIFLFLKVKLDFWEKPPYIFAGLAHWDADIARRCGKLGTAYENGANTVSNGVGLSSCLVGEGEPVRRMGAPIPSRVEKSIVFVTLGRSCSCLGGGALFPSLVYYMPFRP